MQNLPALEKFANKEVSFICEPLLNWKVGEKTFDRIAFKLIQRDQNHKAIQTMRYYFDFSAIRTLAFMVTVGKGKPEFSEYKTVGEKSRSINIQIAQKGGVHITIANGGKGEKNPDKLWITLTSFEFRRLMLSCFHYVNNYELARHLNGKAYEPVEFDRREGENRQPAGQPPQGYGDRQEHDVPEYEEPPF